MSTALADQFRAAEGCGPLDLILIELTFPADWREWNLRQWPAALVSLMTGGRGFLDCGIVTWEDATLRQVLCGDDDSRCRFARIAQEAAEAFKGQLRYALPPRLESLQRWLYGLMYVSMLLKDSPHALRRKLGLFQQGGRPDAYVGDFDLTAPSAIPHLARMQGFNAPDLRVNYHQLNDLWGASLAVLEQFTRAVGGSNGSNLLPASEAEAPDQPLTPGQAAVPDTTVAKALTVIRSQKGKGIQGKAIITALKKKHIDITESYFRRHIVPKLKQRGVQNHRSRGGYYIDAT
jgi:hypothetical protein